MSDEERSGRPSTPSGGAEVARVSQAPGWTSPGKQIPDALLDEVGLPQAVRRSSPGAVPSPSASQSPGPRGSDPAPLGSQPRARRISLPPAEVDRRPPSGSGSRPIEDAPAPDTGMRRRPGEVVMRKPGQPIGGGGPRTPRISPLADAHGVLARKRGVDMPVLGVFGPYEILGRLAMGGMAEILLARRPGAEPLVIKKILAQYARDDDFVEMFLDEARIGAALDHPNIGRFLDFGEIDKQLFIAMEWVHGVTLGRLIRRARDKGGLPYPVACEIVARVADALHYAHTARDAEGNVMGLIHRDVSPHNVMIDFDGTVKLLDFGIAKAETQAHHTNAGVVKGKFAYMAPEQCRGKALDFRIDIFALGVVLFEGLIGKSLYRRETEAATMHAIVAEPVPSLQEKLPGAPRELEAILRTALQKDPGARFPTAAAMRDVLQQYVSRSAEDVGQERISALVQHLFRDELEAPLVDSTPFGASYDLSSSRARQEDAVPDGRPTLAPPTTGSRSAQVAQPQAPQPAQAPQPVLAPQPAQAPEPEPRLSMDDLFGDGVIDDVPKAPAPVVPASLAPPAPVTVPPAAGPQAKAEDPLGLFADLPVPDAPPVEIDVEVPEPTRMPAPQPARPSRPSEPTRAPLRSQPRAQPMPDRPSVTPMRASVPTRSDPTGSRGLTPTPSNVAPPSTSGRVWKLLATLLAMVVVGLAVLALIGGPTNGPTTLTVVTVPPGAPVSVNGSPAVPSPATFTNLGAGAQQVVVQGEGGPRWEGSVDVADGSTRTLRVVLE
ncbi:MAG: protein kinase [Sandaracinus sp.]|nr:protein kinase [Kofleriaceae bacterium]MCB9602728.1 protein kinase [Sandaracinus sp.]MCB9632144.1 protein kinase [Sandaracinus sp.]